jgi:hypothetical protein
MMNLSAYFYKPNALTLGQLHDPLIALNPDLAKLTYKGLAIVQGMGVWRRCGCRGRSRECSAAGCAGAAGRT